MARLSSPPSDPVARARREARRHVLQAVERLQWHGDSEKLSFVLRLLRLAEVALAEEVVSPVSTDDGDANEERGALTD